MVNNDTNFKSIELLRCWCMKSLPTVFSDALSYNQQVCLLTKAINDMANTINGLPDYIIELVKELLNQLGLEEIVKEVLAELYFVNVKNPPNNMTAAVGDGVTDDTAAIQAMISYLNSKRAYLFFPAGIYSVTGLNVTTNMSLIGLDRYQTTLQLRAGSNKDLLIGDLGSCTISDITLDANMPGQTQNCSVFDGNVGNMLVSNVIFKNGYDVLGIDVDGLVQMDNIVFDGVQGNGLYVSGEHCTINNIDFINTSVLNNETLITIIGDNNTVRGVSCFTAIKNGVNVSGVGCVISGVIKNAITPVTNTGLGNTIKISTANNNIVIMPNTSESYSGALTVSAPSINELVAGSKTVNTNNVSVIANGVMELDGHADVDVEVGGNLTENVTGDISANANDITNVATNTINLTSQELILNCKNPLTYSKQTEINDYFSGVPAKDNSNNPYTLLTAGPMLDKLTESKEVKNIVFATFENRITVEDSVNESLLQGCTMTADYYYCLYRNSNETSQIIKKINKATLAETDYKFTNLYHGNSMTTDGQYLYVTAWGTNAETNRVYVMDLNCTVITSLETVAITGLGFDGTNVYGYGSNSVYKFAFNGTTLTYSKFVDLDMSYINPSVVFQGLGCYDEKFYMPSSIPHGFMVWNYDGSWFGYLNEPFPIDMMFSIGELEDCEVINGVITQFSSYNAPGTALRITLISTIDLVHGTFMKTITQPTQNHYNLNVDFSTTEKFRDGTTSRPFKEIYEAIDCAMNLSALNGLGSYIIVKNTGVYRKFEIRSGVYDISPASGSSNFKCESIAFYNRDQITVNNVLFTRNATTNSGIICSGSIVKFINLSFANTVTGQQLINCINANVTILGLGGVSESGYVLWTSDALRTANIYMLFNTRSVVTMYDTTWPVNFATSGYSYFTKGLVVANNITSNGAVTFDGLNNTTSMPNVRNNFSYYLFVIGGVGYVVVNNCSIAVGGVTYAITLTNTGISVTATGGNPNITEIVGIN